jgi:hypothetical protein
MQHPHTGTFVFVWGLVFMWKVLQIIVEQTERKILSSKAFVKWNQS